MNRHIHVYIILDIDKRKRLTDRRFGLCRIVGSERARGQMIGGQQNDNQGNQKNNEKS